MSLCSHDASKREAFYATEGFKSIFTMILFFLFVSPTESDCFPIRTVVSIAMPGASSYNAKSSVTRTGLKPAMTRTERERQTTVSNLHRQPTTERGRGVAEDMDSMMDDYYGASAQEASRAPVTVAHGSSPMAKHVPLTDSVQSLAWRKGPANQEGLIFDASDRNLLCMDVLGPAAVVGSADHGLRVFNIETGKPMRTLFSKRYGHTEWVTSCKYLSDGRILSGGMDSKLCLWERSGVRCADLLGHTGSISQVDVNDAGIAISSAYDRTIRVWDCRSGGAALSTLTGHQSPIMQFEWAHNHLLSGDRKGVIHLWDLERGETLLKFATKGGQIGSLALTHDDDLASQLALVGDQSGTMTAIDVRSNEKVFQDVLHPGGVVSALKSTTKASNNLLVTAGADKRMLCLEPRAGFRPIYEFSEHKDFIYSLETFGNFVLSGGGNGWLLVHDVDTGKCNYGLGANEAAVRSIFASQTHIVAAGDDGKAVVYEM